MSPDLYYTNKDGRVDQIGEWAGWFSEVGEAIGTSAQANLRYILGMALPVRPFAALFLALGIIKGRESNTDIQRSDNSEYFTYLESRPIPTNVTFLMKDRERFRQRVGILVGIEYSNGQKAIKVRYADDKKKKLQLTRYFYTYNCHDVSILSKDSTIDISNYRKRGQSVIRSQNFLSLFLPDDNISILALTSRFDCLLVGTQKRLFFELDFNFSLKNTKNKTSLHGTLKDIIRPRNNTPYTGSYRSLICPVSMRKPPATDGISPWCVIFDSADGYLKWHQLYETSHQIVILDRTEKRFKEATSHINQRYYRRADSRPAFAGDLPPTLKGIETIYFTEH